MKCPKCGYISFDYNEVCPKCNRDISGEGAKMNHPSYIPSPPSLLGSLIGETNDTPTDLELSLPESVPLSRTYDMGAEETSPDISEATEPEEFEISIDSEMEDEIELEDLTADDSELSQPEEEILFEPELTDLEEIEGPESLMDQDAVSIEGAENLEEELDLALDLDDDLESDTEEDLKIDLSEESGQPEEEIIFDLEEPDLLSEDEIEPKLSGEVTSKLAEAASLLDDISGDEEKKVAESKPLEDMDEELTLDLDSLEFELDLDEPEEK